MIVCEEFFTFLSMHGLPYSASLVACRITFNSLWKVCLCLLLAFINKIHPYCLVDSKEVRYTGRSASSLAMHLYQFSAQKIDSKAAVDIK